MFLFVPITNIFYSPISMVPPNFWRELYLECVYMVKWRWHRGYEDMTACDGKWKDTRKSLHIGILCDRFISVDNCRLPIIVEGALVIYAVTSRRLQEYQDLHKDSQCTYHKLIKDLIPALSLKVYKFELMPGNWCSLWYSLLRSFLWILDLVKTHDSRHCAPSFTSSLSNALLHPPPVPTPPPCFSVHACTNENNLQGWISPNPGLGLYMNCQ